VEGTIELKRINFSYPSRPDVIIFKDFNLRVPSGKSFALVGQSGSGKSSVISLILRFYDPTSGKVLIDGKIFELPIFHSFIPSLYVRTYQ
jgi:ATP-binding cassette subfamily B (MDR/TAP) protein 1